MGSVHLRRRPFDGGKRICADLRKLLLLSILSTIATPVLAQHGAATADVTGAVTDQSGALVGGAILTAIETSTQVQRTTTTGDDGRFRLTALPPGTYTI